MKNIHTPPAGGTPSNEGCTFSICQQNLHPEKTKMNHRLRVISVVFILMIVLITPLRADVPPVKEWFGTPTSSLQKPVRLSVPVSDAAETLLIFDFNGAELISTPGRSGFEVEIPGEGHTSVQGVPSLPKVSRMVAVPAQVRVRLEYVYGEVDVYENIELLPTMEGPVYDLAPDAELVYDAEIYDADRLFPGELVELGEPVIMRDLRLIRVTVNPLRYNPVDRRLELYRHVEVTLRYEEEGTINTKPVEPSKVSRSFAQIYRHRVVNFRHLDLEVDDEWGSLLIIAPNNATVLSYVQYLADWKIRKGFTTVVADLSQTGGSSSQIKSFIQQAYDTYEPKLAYLILIGDAGGSINVPASNTTGDHDYSRLEGGDILADIAVARFSCANNTQLLTEINKVLMYEGNPFMGQTDWYKKGAVCCGSGSGISPIMTKQGIRMKALLNGYTQVDTLWWYMGSITSFTNSQINAGVGFYNFRGWMGMGGYGISNIGQLVNYNKLPFVVTITCGTGDIVGSGSDYTEEFFRVGSPTNPTGAIGAIGTATMGTHTRYNNCMDNGIFGAFYDYDIFQFGDAMVSGKFDLYMSFPDNPSNVTSYSNWNNLIGDPSCQLWTDIPIAMTVAYQDTLPFGSTSIEVMVTDSVSGIPLEGVDICLNGLGLFMFALSDENGGAIFTLPSLNEDSYQLTCCIHNYKPHLGRFEIEVEDVYVSYEDAEIDDDAAGASSGNGDGNINPGETIELGLSLKNYGDFVTASDILATLNIPSELVTVSDSTENYPDLDPGVSSAVISGFVFTVGQDAVNGAVLPFNLNVSTSQGDWDSYLPLNVEAPEIVYQIHVVQDPNGRLDPGDQSPVAVTLMNVGGLTGENLTAFMSCDNIYISVVQSSSGYGSLAPQQSGAGDPFEVNVSPLIVPGTTVHFNLNITGDNGYSGLTGFDLVVGAVEEDDPTGPDEYGYYAIDNTDTGYSGYPIYEWVEIDPTYGGAGEIIDLSDYGDEQDDTKLIRLPLTLQYYGEDFDEIAVCSNGWLAFGDMSYYTNFRNWYIPSTLGPYSLVAAFWDDLYLMYSPPGKVYKYYDETNHRFIVEWSRVKNRAPGNPVETFEVILLDPQYYPTSTGDCEIIFQYHTVANVQGQGSDNHYATVGIKSNDNLMGLQYSYWNHYSHGAAELRAGQAIKFTTNIPINLSPPAIVHDPIPNITEPMDGYPVETHISSWTALNYDSLKVFWSTELQGTYSEETLIPLSAGVPYEFIAAIPEQPPGNAVYYYLFAQDIQGAFSYLPTNAPASVFMFLIGNQVEMVFDDAELETGWTLGVPGDDATTGIWVREDPVESIADNGHLVQPEDDHTPDPGHICYVTGNADSGAIAGTNDVDGGKTTLVTPVYDLSGVNFPSISYWYWYTNNQGNNPGQDEWVVDVSNDGGANWVNIVTTTSSTPEIWMMYQFTLLNYVSPSDEVQMRFIASDYSPGSLVEACIDDFRIVGLDTTWDNPEPYQFVAPSDISLVTEANQITLKWLPVEGAKAYRIYLGDTPYFSPEQGYFAGEIEDNFITLNLTDRMDKKFCRINIIR